MKIKIETGGLKVEAETTQQTLFYSDLEIVMKVLATAMHIDYDSFMNVANSSLMDKFAEDLRKEFVEELEHAREFNKAKKALEVELEIKRASAFIKDLGFNSDGEEL